MPPPAAAAVVALALTAALLPASAQALGHGHVVPPPEDDDDGVCEGLTLRHHLGVPGHRVFMQAAKDFGHESVRVVQMKPEDIYTHIRHSNASRAADPSVPSTRGELVTVAAPWVAALVTTNSLAELTDHLRHWQRLRGIRGSITRDFLRQQDLAYRFPSPGSAVPHWRSIPLSSGANIFAYRKDLYLEHFSNSTPPATLNDAVRFANHILSRERVAGRGSHMSGFAVAGRGEEVMHSILSFVAGNGASFVTPQGRCNFENQQFLQAFRMYSDVHAAMQRRHQLQTSSALINAFARGEIVHLCGPSYDLIRKLGDLEHIGFATVPAGAIAQFTFLDGIGISIPTGQSKACERLGFSYVRHLVEGPYLMDLVRTEPGALPAYETHLQTMRREADGVSLGGFRLYDAGMNVIPLQRSYFHTPSTKIVEGSAVGNLADGEAGYWLDFEKQPNFEVVLPHLTDVSYYALQTGDVLERDPISWRFGLSNQEPFAPNRIDADWWESPTISAVDQVPIGRNKFTDILPIPGGPVAVRTIRFTVMKLRKVLCGTGCQSVMHQRSTTVPVRYPVLDFYDAMQLEHNGTIGTMLGDVVAGLSHEQAARHGCESFAELIRPPLIEAPASSSGPLMKSLGIGASALVIMLVFAVVMHRFVYVKEMQSQITKLRSDNDMAEDLCKAVAVMELDAVEYLFSVEKPTRIQQSFIQIVRTLREYRAYLPAALLAACNGENGDQASEGGESSSSWSYSKMSHDSSLCVDNFFDRAKSEDGHSMASGFAAGGVGAMNIGIRVKKATVMMVFNLNPGPGSANSWMEPVLNCIHTQEGIGLIIRPDSILASWNTHKVCPKHSQFAANCAVHIQARVGKMANCKVNVALSGGRMQVGHFGGAQQKAPFVIGSSVRQVELMGSLCKQLQVGILATEHVVKNMRLINARPVDVISESPMQDTPIYVTVWEVVGLRPVNSITDGCCEHGSTNGTSGCNERYRAAWVAMRNADFSHAHAMMVDYSCSHPTDYQAVRLCRLTYMAMTNPERLFGGVQVQYYRKHTAWADFEGQTRDVCLPKGVVDIDAPPPSLEASIPQVQKGNEGDDLRTELEREKSRSGMLQPFCEQCKQPLKHSEHFEEGRWDQEWLCVACQNRACGRRWVCVMCKASTCYSCSPHLRSDCGGAVGLVIKDRQGNEYRRSETVLGKGAYGTVWLGMDMAGALLAIKTVRIKPDLVRETNSLVTEVELLSCLRHDNIVSYVSSCVFDSHVIILMEYVSGGSLGFLLEQFGKVSLEALRRYLKDILMALDFLHSHGFVHRDIKPANVLLMTDGQCKLSDFGTSTTQKVTESGDRIVGTPVFMSPEAARGECCKEVDIWSLGISVFQLHTGQIPYTKRNLKAKQLIDALARGEPVPKLETVEGEIGNFIQLCLTMDAQRRPSAAKLLLHSMLL